MGAKKAAFFAGAMLFVACAHEPPALQRELSWRALSSELPRQTATGTFDPQAYEGKVVLLSFITTWCFPCLADMVSLEKLSKDHGAKGFVNVLVGLDIDGIKVLQPFAESYALQWPLIVGDERLRTGDTSFGHFRELPARILFAKDGHVIVGYSGVPKFEDLDRLVAQAVLAP